MTPVTHAIIANPTNRTMSVDRCSRFYFKTEDYTVLLSNNVASLVNLPVLPQPSNAIVTEDSLPPLSFVPSGNLDANSADVGTMFQMVRELQQRKEKSTLVSEIEEHFVDQTNFSFMNGIGSFLGNMFSGITSFTWSLLLPVIYVAVVVGIFMLFSCTGMLPVVAKLPFQICYIFRFSNFKRASKYVRKFFGCRQGKRLSSEKRNKKYAPLAPISYIGQGPNAWMASGVNNWHAPGTSSNQYQEGQNWQSQNMQGNQPRQAQNIPGSQPWQA